MPEAPKMVVQRTFRTSRTPSNLSNPSNPSNLSNPSNRELRAYLATYMAGAAFRAPFASSAAVRSIADDV
jgi:hypothetical protein